VNVSIKLNLLGALLPATRRKSLKSKCSQLFWNEWRQSFIDRITASDSDWIDITLRKDGMYSVPNHRHFTRSPTFPLADVSISLEQSSKGEVGRVGNLFTLVKVVDNHNQRHHCCGIQTAWALIPGPCRNDNVFGIGIFWAGPEWVDVFIKVVCECKRIFDRI